MGDIEGERKIEIKGLAIKISCHVNYSSFAVQEVIDYLLRVLVTYGLLNEDSILKLNNTLNIASSPPSQVALPPQKTPAFFDKSVIAKEARSKLKETVSRNIKSISPKYRRWNEGGINPVYRKIGDIHQSLHLNEKYIWLLTSDGLATGIKNAYDLSFNNRTLFDAIDEKLHPYVNWDDRYGHPSIAIPHEHYDGSALYGGYVCQRQGYLQVFTSSGRYYRDDLTLGQKRKLEAYVSWKLMNAFGEQAILFQEGPYLDYFELSLFYANKPLPPEIQTRKYTLADIKAIFNEGDESKHNQYSISQLFKDDQLFNRFVEGLREEGMAQRWNWTA